MKAIIIGAGRGSRLGPGRGGPAVPRHMPGEPRSEPGYPQPGPDPRRLPDTHFGRNGQAQAQPRFVRKQLPEENLGNAMSPAGVHQDWAALDQRARQDAHDYDGGYPKEYRQ